MLPEQHRIAIARIERMSWVGGYARGVLLRFNGMQTGLPFRPQEPPIGPGLLGFRSMGIATGSPAFGFLALGVGRSGREWPRRAGSPEGAVRPGRRPINPQGTPARNTVKFSDKRSVRPDCRMARGHAAAGRRPEVQARAVRRPSGGAGAPQRGRAGPCRAGRGSRAPAPSPSWR